MCAVASEVDQAVFIHRPVEYTGFTSTDIECIDISRLRIRAQYVKAHPAIGR